MEERIKTVKRQSSARRKLEESVFAAYLRERDTHPEKNETERLEAVCRKYSMRQYQAVYIVNKFKRQQAGVA